MYQLVSSSKTLGCTPEFVYSPVYQSVSSWKNLGCAPEFSCCVYQLVSSSKALGCAAGFSCPPLLSCQSCRACPPPCVTFWQYYFAVNLWKGGCGQWSRSKGMFISAACCSQITLCSCSKCCAIHSVHLALYGHSEMGMCIMDRHLVMLQDSIAGILVILISLAFPFFGVINSFLGAGTTTLETYIIPALAYNWVYQRSSAQIACPAPPPW